MSQSRGSKLNLAKGNSPRHQGSVCPQRPCGWRADCWALLSHTEVARPAVAGLRERSTVQEETGDKEGKGQRRETIAKLRELGLGGLWLRVLPGGCRPELKGGKKCSSPSNLLFLLLTF